MSNSSAGEHDVSRAFAAAGLPVPPVPGALATRLDCKEPWFWSTREIDVADLYDPALFIAEAASPVDDYLAIAHVGHGINSYFLTYQLVYRQLALFAQVQWGGPLSSDSRSAEDARRMFQDVAALIATIERNPSADAGLRLVVLDSRAKGIDVCTWVAVDGQPRPELERWPRSSSSTNAIQRGLAALARSDDVVDEPATRDVRVEVELDWAFVGPVTSEAGRLVFPPTLPAGPGLYRLTFIGDEPTSAYVGEASNSRRRAGHYRLGDPGLPTNKRLHDRLLQHLGANGSVTLDIAQSATIAIHGRPRELELGRKASRILAEAAAIHALPNGVSAAKLRGIGDLDPSVSQSAEVIE